VVKDATTAFSFTTLKGAFNRGSGLGTVSLLILGGVGLIAMTPEMPAVDSDSVWPDKKQEGVKRSASIIARF
jgi:hypothetical protein